MNSQGSNDSWEAGDGGNSNEGGSRQTHICKREREREERRIER